LITAAFVDPSSFGIELAPPHQLYVGVDAMGRSRLFD